jgi:hypothetical protein
MESEQSGSQQKEKGARAMTTTSDTCPTCNPELPDVSIDLEKICDCHDNFGPCPWDIVDWQQFLTAFETYAVFTHSKASAPAFELKFRGDLDPDAPENATLGQTLGQARRAGLATRDFKGTTTNLGLVPRAARQHDN